jgi:hypothetical protein
MGVTSPDEEGKKMGVQKQTKNSRKKKKQSEKIFLQQTRQLQPDSIFILNHFW